MKAGEAHRGWLLSHAPILFAVPLFLFTASIACGQDGTGGVLDTTQCRLRYDDGMEDDAHALMNVITTEYDLLVQQLGIRPQDRIEARLFRGMGTFVAEAGSENSQRPAVYSRGLLLIRPPRGISEEQLYMGISYEMAVIFLFPSVERACPLWLARAFAVYHAGVSPDCRAPSAAGLGSFADLSQAMQQARTGADRADMECLLSKTMQFFIDRYGQEKVLKVFVAFDGMATAEQVFPKVFGEKFTAVEKAWSQTVVQDPERPKRH